MHKNISSYQRAIKQNLSCVSCSARNRIRKTLLRNCPKCNKEILYKRHDALVRAERAKTFCSHCYRKGPSSKGLEKIKISQYKRWGTIPSNNNSFTKGQLLTWKRKIFEKDNYCCNFCNSTKNLHAHHIFSKSRHPELALNLNNGITLCEECHLEEHRLNGLI